MSTRWGWAFGLVASLWVPSAAALEGKPFIRPDVGGRVVFSPNGPSTQVLGGATAGYTFREPGDPDIAGYARLQAGGIYSLSHDSVGGMARLGVFAGPSISSVFATFGPDVWVDAYGTVSSNDYYLPLGSGVEFPLRVTVTPVSELSITGFVSPGFVIAGDRVAPGLSPFHTLSVGGFASVNAGSLSLTLGVQREWTVAGPLNGLILGFRIR